MKLVLVLSLFFAASAFGMTCYTEGSNTEITLEIVDVNPEKDYFEDEAMTAQVTIQSVAGEKKSVTFMATGTNGKMAAGELIELANKAQEFKYENGFNGSELNGWVIPEAVIYQGTQYSSCRN